MVLDTSGAAETDDPETFETKSEPSFLDSETEYFKNLHKWEIISTRILKQGYWSRLGDLAKAIHSLPDDVSAMFQRLEKSASLTIEEELRFTYYKEFIRTALGASVVRLDEIRV